MGIWRNTTGSIGNQMATCVVHRAARIVFRTNAPTERLTTLDGRLAAAEEASEVGDDQKKGWEDGYPWHLS